MKFERWLADLLCQNEIEVRRLLGDSAALHFLITWSLFESKCFEGYVKIGDLGKYAERVIDEAYDPAIISEAAFHFHARYQDTEPYRNLMHQQSSVKMDNLIRDDLDSLRPQDKVFMVLLVVYRFRNNIFHGNKGVRSWLHYKPQIRLCTEAMQSFVSHAEEITPSLRAAEVA